MNQHIYSKERNAFQRSFGNLNICKMDAVVRRSENGLQTEVLTVASNVANVTPVNIINC